MSMTYVGEAYRSGIGTAKDLTQAAEWFQRAANEGYIVASYKLGKVCQELNQHSRALEAFALGAAGQHLPSIYMLGRMYLHGIGVEKDVHIARKYFEEASNLGHVFAKT
jgi:TPR repeat protein